MGGPSEHGVAPGERIVIEVPPTIDPEAVLNLLQLGSARSTLVLNGGTSEFSPVQGRAVAAALRIAVAELAGRPGPIVVSGGTAAGVFNLLGDAIAALGFAHPVVGVVLSAKVDVRGDGLAGRRAVEPHHTHIVAVDGDQWGDETPLMMGLADALERRGPVVVVIAGGGDVAEAELERHLEAGRRPVVLRGTGRLANRVRAGKPDVGPIALDVDDLDRITSVLRAMFAGGRPTE